MVLANQEGLGGTVDHVLFYESTKRSFGWIAHMQPSVEVHFAASLSDALVY